MPLLDELLADLKSGDEARALSAVKRLAGMDASAQPALLDLAHSPESDHRWWAIHALGESPHTRPGNLVPFLNDPAPDVRQAALLGLCTHAEEESIPALIDGLWDDDPMAAGLAVNALIKLGRPAVPALLDVMESAPLGVRVHALRALAEIQDHRAIPAMMKAIQEDSALLQHWASEGLERLGLDMVYIKP